jgi:hypothetical protein
MVIQSFPIQRTENLAVPSISVIAGSCDARVFAIAPHNNLFQDHVQAITQLLCLVRMNIQVYSVRRYVDFIMGIP